MVSLFKIDTIECILLALTELSNLKTKTTPKCQTVTHYTAIHPDPHIPSVYWKIINTSVFTIGYTILKRLFLKKKKDMFYLKPIKTFTC